MALLTQPRLGQFMPSVQTNSKNTTFNTDLQNIINQTFNDTCGEKIF